MTIGNLPAHAQVLIKITYVAELSIDGDELLFTLPAAVSPSTADAAMNEVSMCVFLSVCLSVFVFVCVSVSMGLCTHLFSCISAYPYYFSLL